MDLISLEEDRLITSLIFQKWKKRNADDDPDNDREPNQVIDNIKEILRSRIDPQGTRELNIYKSEYGDEIHVIVEITSDLDTEETLEKLRQVIDLKFKEPMEEATEEELAELKITAEEFLVEANGENFLDKAQFQNGKDNSMFRDDVTYWYDSMQGSFNDDSEEVWNTEVGSVFPRIVEKETNTFMQNAEGGFELKTNTEFHIIYVKSKEVTEREKTIPGDPFETVKDEVSERDDRIYPEETHSAAAEEGTEEVMAVEAEEPPADEALAEDMPVEIIEEVTIEDVDLFAEPEIIIEDPEAIPEPEPQPDYPELLSVDPSFHDTLLELGSGQYSEVLESETEYVIFQVLPPNPDDVATRVSGIYISKSTPNARELIDAAYERITDDIEVSEEQQLTLSQIVFAFDIQGWKDTELGGMQFKRARVGSDPNTGRPLVEILFNEEGAQLFEELTAAHVGDRMAIFVGGVMVSAPTINEKIAGGAAVITIGSASYADAQKEAIALARELNGGSTPAPFVEKGQFKIGAMLGKDALDKSLKAGLLGFLILAVWMIIFYRYLGMVAVMALAIYGIFILFLLQANLPFGTASLIGILTFSVSMYSFSTLGKK